MYTYSIKGAIICIVHIKYLIIFVPYKFRFRKANVLAHQIGILITTDISILQFLDEFWRNCAKIQMIITTGLYFYSDLEIVLIAAL